MKQKLNKELLLLLPDEVKAMNLPPKAQEIYCQFIAMADKNGWCYSTVEGLANELNCSKTTIMSNIKVLENRNLILERVVGKKGTATKFKIKLNDTEYSTESCNNDTEYSTESCNNDTEYSTESCNNDSTELKKYIEEVITLKINELRNDIIFELRGMINNDSTIKENKIKEKKLKQNNNIDTNTNSSYNIQEVIDIDKKKDINIKENIEIDMNKDIDRSTCKYKRRKQNDYQLTIEEEEDDYNEIVENTKVEGFVSKSDGNTSKSKRFFYSLIDSSLTFNSYTEALKYSMNNNLNFDENFNKVEVLV